MPPNIDTKRICKPGQKGCKYIDLHTQIDVSGYDNAAAPSATKAAKSLGEQEAVEHAQEDADEQEDDKEAEQHDVVETKTEDREFKDQQKQEIALQRHETEKMLQQETQHIAQEEEADDAEAEREEQVKQWVDHEDGRDPQPKEKPKETTSVVAPGPGPVLKKKQTALQEIAKVAKDFGKKAKAVAKTAAGKAKKKGKGLAAAIMAKARDVAGKLQAHAKKASGRAKKAMKNLCSNKRIPKMMKALWCKPKLPELEMPKKKTCVEFFARLQKCKKGTKPTPKAVLVECEGTECATKCCEETPAPGPEVKKDFVVDIHFFSGYKQYYVGNYQEDARKFPDAMTELEGKLKDTAGDIKNGIVYQLGGHASAKGNAAKNKLLSKHRSQSVACYVADWLKRKGYSKATLKLGHFGEEKARQGPVTAAQAKHDRRVDIFFSENKELTAKFQPATTWELGSADMKSWCDKGWKAPGFNNNWY
jgi:hypothetical protein